MKTKLFCPAKFCKCLVVCGCLLFFGLSSCTAQPDKAQRWLPATAEKMPRWRGFNLLEKF